MLHRLSIPWLAVFVTMAAGVAIAEERFSFFVSARTVSGEPVNDLRPEDLSVTEDGRAGRIVQVTRVRWPVKVTVLLDNGFNTDSLLSIYRTGLKAFFEQLPVDVEVALLTLSPQPRWIVRPTADHGQLVAGVDRLTPDSNAPRTVDALFEAASRVEQENRKERTHFPVVVVVSTTGPEGSRPGDRDLNRMVRQFTNYGARVHVIMLSTNGTVPNDTLGAQQVHVAKFLADQTGGRYEALAASTRIATLLPEYARMIVDADAVQRDQYLVTAERPAGAGAPGQRVIGLTRIGVSFTVSVNGLGP